MAEVLEVGNPEKSKKLFSNTFTANQVQTTKNPISEGFGAAAQICELEICLDGTAVDLLGGAGTILFATEAQVDALLDSIISTIEFGSSPLGQMIKPQSLSQLRRNVTGFDGTYLDNVPNLGKSTTIAANTYNLNLRLGVRWALPEYANIGYAHSPFCGSMNDDGLDITFGGGTFTDGNAVVFTIANSTTVTIRLRTELGRPVSRVSPLVYATSVAPGTDGSQFPKGGYYSLGNCTDNATNVASNVSGSGYRILVDGVLVQQYSSHDPRSRYLAISKGWEDRGACLRDHFSGMADEDANPLNQNWNPLFSADIRGNASERIEVTDRMVIDQGSLWTGAGCVFCYVYVRPLKDIGAGIGPCGCGPGEREIQVRMKNPLRLTNAQGDPKGSMISPRAIVSTE